MYYSNITNPEIQFFHGLTVPNFTIKLSDILHKTGDVFDNKLFQVEQITDNIYRIVPMFYCEEITATNNKDRILDDQCIIAHQEETETYITFTGDANNTDIQDYQNLTSYFKIGDSLTLNQYNHIIGLLRQHITNTDSIEINDSVNGTYGDYQFQIENCSFLDTGILITNETLSSEPKVRLLDPKFRWSTYTLQLTVFHYTGVNILDDVDPEDLKVVDTIEVELVSNEWVDIPIEDLEEDYIISFDATVEITHTKNEVHRISGLQLYTDPSIIKTTETAEITGHLLDTDGGTYDLSDASGYTVYFFEEIEPTLSVSATPDIIEIDDTSDITAKVVDGDGSIVKDTLVYFYREIEQQGDPEVTSLLLTSDKDTLSYYNSDSATLTATVLDQYGLPMEDEEVVFMIGDTVLDTVATDSTGKASYTYSSAGTGEVTFTAECETIDDTYTIMDYWYNGSTEYSSETSLDITLPSAFKLSFAFKPTDRTTSGGGNSTYLRMGSSSTTGIWVGQGTSGGSHGIMVRPSTNLWCTTSSQTATWNDVECTFDGTVLTYTCNNESVNTSTTSSVLTKVNGVVPTSKAHLKDIKIIKL